MLALSGMFALALSGCSTPPSNKAPPELVDMDGNVVSIDVGADLSSTAIEAMDIQVAPTGPHMVMAATGLDVPLGEVSAFQGQITPPSFTSAFRVRGAGVDLAHADQGTVFVVMHSVAGGRAPGNYLLDPDTLDPKVSVGMEIEAGPDTYTVTGVHQAAKDELASASEVWANTPGRLVVITCVQRASGESVNNLIVEANLDEAPIAQALGTVAQ